MNSLYFDYMATTPIDPFVLNAMQPYFSTCFANPDSQHVAGYEAKAAVDTATQQVATAINSDPYDLIWTSGATESNNLAIKGLAGAQQTKKHLITCRTEHDAVLKPMAYLASQGFEVDYVATNQRGLIEPDQLDALLRDDTLLVSLMHVNNETGVIQAISQLAKLVHAKGALLHVDAAQSVGKLPVDVQAFEVDLMSLSAHKCYGPKGVGALYKKPTIRLATQQHGGGADPHRAGTLPVHQLVGMGAAYQLAEQLRETETKRIRLYRDHLWRGIQSLSQVYLNGDWEQRVVHNLNVSFAGVDGQALRVALRDLGISQRSACTSSELNPSHVLLAMGQIPELAHSALRFSFGRFTTLDDIDHAIHAVKKAVTRLRNLSPCWGTIDVAE